MRQRYLLGKYNRHKYFNSTTFTPDHFYVQSTSYYRTIKSGYAEILGIFEDRLPPKLSDD